MLDASVIQRIRALPTEKQGEFLALIEERDKAQKILTARDSFMGYVEYSWPAFIRGRHHEIIAEAFDRIIDGSLKRLIITLAPRFSKSMLSSIYLPSKFMGHYPAKKIIQTSHTAELAVGFGRKVRNMVATKSYRALFPKTTLKADSKAAGRWETSAGGEYFAIGVGGAVAGKGADLLIIDDPSSEQDFIRALGGDSSPFDDTFEWYQTGPRQRLQPGAGIVILMTRWHTRDMAGRLIQRMTSSRQKEQWEIIEFPALFDDDTSMWPEFWSAEELIATRGELSAQQWNAQFQQNPTAEEGALVKREWWQLWDGRKPPQCEFIIQSWDTAYTKKESSDYSACTTWGIFYKPNDEGLERPNIILLDAFRKRIEFPDLKKEALDLYKFWEPDATIIEAKASGLPLIQELRNIGVPIQEYTPVRGARNSPNAKIVRVNTISDLFASGVVWRPDTRWAEDVVEEFAAFPLGEYDDLVDSSTIALMRFRQGGFIRLDSDEPEAPKKKRIADYY